MIHGWARALAWREARQAWMLAAVSAAALVVAGALMSGTLARQHFREAALLFAAPAVSAALGAAARARETPLQRWLAARPVSSLVREVIAVAVHGLAAALVFAAAWASASFLPAGREGAWLEALDVPARHATTLGAALSLAAFLFAAALASWISDVVTAGIAAVTATAMLAAALLAPLTAWAGGSLESVLEGLPALAAPLVGAPAALLVFALLRPGEDLAGQRSPARRRSAGWCGAAVAATAFVLAPLGLRPLREARAVARGEGRAVGDSVLLHRTGSVAALRVIPPGGTEPLTVLHFLDAREGRSTVHVLRAERPVAWLWGGTGLLARWPGGTVRQVSFSGRTNTPGDLDSTLRTDASPARIELSQLVVQTSAGDVVAWPPSREPAR